jgi:hypothetical protein
LYSSNSKLQLQIKALTEEFKTAKVKTAMMLRASRDEKIRKASIREEQVASRMTVKH